MLTSQNNLYIISAPSGCGKTSLINALVQNMSHLNVSVSHTTRPQRPGEIEGKDYFFVSPQDFQKKIAADEFVEYAQVMGLAHWYGTSKVCLEKQQKACDTILEIDWQGAKQIKTIMPQSVSIFILPPNLTSLENRLKQRGQDEPKVIQERMSQAKQEIIHFSEYDYAIVNDNFNHALAQLKSIITAERLKISPSTSLDFNIE